MPPKPDTHRDLLIRLLDRSLTDARVEYLLPDGRVQGGSRNPAAAEFAVRVTDPAFFRRSLAQGNLGHAESYMDGGWDMERGTLEGYLTALTFGRLDEQVGRDLGFMLRVGALRLRQIVAGTLRNVQDHYDIGSDLYEAFLDETRGYTCGYQVREDDDSKTLQEQKYDRVCRKLRLEPGQTLFDVGCGYGGLMMHAASRYGVRATGITNSRDHAEWGARRVAALGLEGKVELRYGDLRAASGTYDRVVSCGVLEHLLPSEHEAFFGTVARLLHPDGWGLVHTIGCITHTNDHDPFIQKYIFPGSTQNPLSVIAGHLERKRLAITDVENIGRHYAPTSRRWLEAYRANRAALDPARYPARFQRMWEYYLALCVAGASASDGAVWQVLFTRNYRRALPLHRV